MSVELQEPMVVEVVLTTQLLAPPEPPTVSTYSISAGSLSTK